MDGVQGYDEDQIALVVPDESKFAEQIPIVLGTSTISHIINVMAHLLSVHRAVATEVDDQTLKSANPNGYDEEVFMINMETIEAFSS